MRIAIFGGTFNPIHNGHINLCVKIKEIYKIDKLVIIPTKTPPHKNITELADDYHRYEMCHLGFLGYTGIEVSDIEINRGGKSFTINTLRHFKNSYPNDKLYFIMGSDMFLTFKSWVSYVEILSLVTIIVVPRNSAGNALCKNFLTEFGDLNAEIIIAPIEPLEISSTEIRELIKKNRDFSCYLPEKVVQYICDNKLFME